MKSPNQIFLFTLMLVLAGFSIASAQTDDDSVVSDDDSDDDNDDDNDDDAEFTASLAFDSPTELLPSTDYEFEFTVENTTSESETHHWIIRIEMFMPASDYVIDYDNVSAPEAIHEGEWEFEDIMDDGYPGIRWQFSGIVTSETYGDIRDADARMFANAADEGDIPEDESLGGFTFTATTDEAGTDGFPWAVWSGDGLFFMDKTCVVAANCADADDDADDDTLDDDSVDETDDDDDSNAGGCGC